MKSSKPYWLSIDLIEKIPAVGLLKAIYHYLTNDKKKFKRCLIKQSKIFINVMKIHEKFKQKPNKKLKYIAKMGIRAFLYVGCGAIGLYFCSKTEKNLYGYIYGEFKKYLALCSCAVFLLF